MHPLTSRFHRLLYVNVSLYLLLTLLLAACGTATTITSPSPSQIMISHVDHLLTTEVQDEIFSGSVLIARGGKVLFSKGYSLADWQQRLLNTPHTKFHAASLTKQFTAMAILILQEQGKLHVQDHACTYVPDCPSAWQPITIHQLLTHTSGIPTLINPPTTLPSSPQQFTALSKNTPLDFPVGTQFRYSNLGYQLLGYIIQQVSGEPYAEFVQHSIFAPLQMRETDFDPAYPPRPDQATGYVEWQIPATPLLLYQSLSSGWFDQSLPSGWSFLLAAGGLDSTVEDLYRWDQALYTHTLVSALSLEQMFTPYISTCPSSVGLCPTASTSSSYGFGWVITKEPGRHVIWHSGSGSGFTAYIGRYPDDKTTIIVLGNLESYVDPFAVASDVEMEVFARP